jgi:hypothetical protein
MRLSMNVFGLLLLTTLGSASVQAWPGNQDFSVYYNNAVHALVRGQAFNAANAASYGYDGQEVMTAFAGVVASRHVDDFVSDLIDEVSARSEGAMRLEPISADECPAKFVGATRCFQVIRRGRLISYAVLAQNGISIFK